MRNKNHYNSNKMPESHQKSYFYSYTRPGRTHAANINIPIGIPMVWRCLAPLKARGNIKNVALPLTSAYFMKICKITKDSAIFFKIRESWNWDPPKLSIIHWDYCHLAPRERRMVEIAFIHGSYRNPINYLIFLRISTKLMGK